MSILFGVYEMIIIVDLSMRSGEVRRVLHISFDELVKFINQSCHQKDYEYYKCVIFNIEILKV